MSQEARLLSLCCRAGGLGARSLPSLVPSYPSPSVSTSWVPAHLPSPTTPPSSFLPVLVLFSFLSTPVPALCPSFLPAVSSISPSSWTQIVFIPKTQVFVKSNSPCILSTSCVNKTFCLLLTRKPPWGFIILRNLLKLIKKCFPLRSPSVIFPSLTVFEMSCLHAFYLWFIETGSHSPG